MCVWNNLEGKENENAFKRPLSNKSVIILNMDLKTYFSNLSLINFLTIIFNNDNSNAIVNKFLANQKIVSLLFYVCSINITIWQSWQGSANINNQTVYCHYSAGLHFTGQSCLKV